MSTADIAAVAVFTTWALMTLVVRVAIHYRQTGTTGLHGIAPGASGPEVAAALLISVSAGAIGIAPLLELWWSIPAVLDTSVLRWIGGVIAVMGTIITFVAQMAMGRSWRVGVDPSERTDLVVDGPFAVVRNPIFSAMIVTAGGLALLVDNVVAIGAFVGLVTAVEIQVRTVEEPYLQIVHGDHYRDYRRRVGRFAPGIGRLGAPRRVIE